MNNKNLKQIYDFLEGKILEKLEYPCDNCNYFECKKNVLNRENIIRKKYKWNDINWRHCLRRGKKRLEELMKILRLPEFKKWSHEICKICKKEFFKYDMEIHLETEKDGHIRKSPSGKETKYYLCESFHLCKKCHRSYTHRKKALHNGFEKF